MKDLSIKVAYETKHNLKKYNKLRWTKLRVSREVCQYTYVSFPITCDTFEFYNVKVFVKLKYFYLEIAFNFVSIWRNQPRKISKQIYYIIISYILSCCLVIMLECFRKKEISFSSFSQYCLTKAQWLNELHSLFHE